MNKPVRFESAPEFLTRVMTERGFGPSNVYNANFIEFAKSYSDDHGRLARAVAQFERSAGPMPLVDPKLAGFGVLVQAHLLPLPAMIEERAPPVMREDLLAVTAAFTSGIPARAAVFERCGTCASVISEFYVKAGKVLCRHCKES